jgi:hypothetical protein
MTKNFAANLKIGAALSSSVNRVFGGLKSKIKEQEAVLKGLRSAYKDASKGVGEYAGKLDELKRKTSEAERELKRLKAAANYSIGGGFKSIGSTFAKDAGRLAAGAGIATAAVTALGAAVYSTTRGFVDWADDIGDSAEALGMSTQALQTWQFAAATVGVGGAKMTASIAKFSKAVMEGGESTDEALGKLGFNAARLRKLKLDQQLEAVAEAFKDYKGADKAALAMKLFGKSGYQLAGILSKGKDGLDEFRKAGEETGAVLTDEAAKAAGDAASALDMFGITMIGLRNTIAIQFVPTLTRLAEKFTSFIRTNGPQIKEWAANFANVIETRVVPALGRFIDKLPEIIDKLGAFATKVASVIVKIKDLVGGWENLGIALVALNFAPTILAIANLTKGVIALTGATWRLLGPIGLVIAVWTTFFSLVGDGNPLDGLLFSIKALGKEADAAWRWIKEIGADVGQWLGRNTEAAITIVDDMIASIKASFEAFFSWIGSKFDWIGQKFTALWQKMKDLANSISGFFTGDDGSTSQVAPMVAPEKMAAPGPARGTANNTWNINVTAPGADGKRIADQIRTEFQRKPLFDADGALVPA